MKAVVQDLGSGKLRVGDIPPPALQPGGLLVRVRRSLISLGTERAIIALATQGPLGKARARPDLVRKVLTKARQEGFWSTYKVVKNLMDSPIPMGYSCAGEVVAVGEEAAEFQVGDRVACAGLNFANHAEIDYVPRNLAVRIPDGVSFDDACFVTIGAIALQGVRLAELQLGETVVVLGLGLVGQIAAQLARAAGATVVAFDPDPAKTQRAGELGAHRITSEPAVLSAAVAQLTDGHGADAVLICAATKSDGPIRHAAELSRLRGRVIVVGDVGMHIERRAYFEKEIMLIVSRSYGPGRYDPTYEVGGTDYPLAYVRWTERRNMKSFLDLVGRRDVRVEPLITQRYPIENAEAAYAVVTGDAATPAIAIVLTYDREAPQPSRVELGRPARALPGTINVGVIGAGQFAKGVLLPEFARHKAVRLHAICTATGVSSQHVAQRYGSQYCTSDPADIFADPDIHAVVIATRHHLHASLAADALRAGKAVFVEKPLALTEDSLAALVAEARASGGCLMVGFNRRFAPLAVRCRDFFRGRTERLAVSYRVNAGAVPADSWVLDPAVGGGRIVGEVCHFVDLICFLTGALPRRIFAEQVLAGTERVADRDAVCVTLRLTDGSVGTIQYLTGGDASVPKEYVEVFGGERTAILDNFRSLSLHAHNRRQRRRLLNQAKGHAEEVAAFVHALETGGPMPIDLESLVAVTQSTFLIHTSLEAGAPVEYESPQRAPATA